MIAVQTAIGPVGGKAATVLTQSYKSMVSCGKYQYGANETGLFLLNQGAVAPSFTLFESDFSTVKRKRFNFVYVTLNSAIDKVITLTVKIDDTTTYTYTKTTYVAGIQRLRFEIGRGAKARTWKFSVSSPSWFEIHLIEALLAEAGI